VAERGAMVSVDWHVDSPTVWWENESFSPNGHRDPLEWPLNSRIPGACMRNKQAAYGHLLRLLPAVQRCDRRHPSNHRQAGTSSYLPTGRVRAGLQQAKEKGTRSGNPAGRPSSLQPGSCRQASQRRQVVEGSRAILLGWRRDDSPGLPKREGK
jgi:hypothetical protein